MLDRPLLLSILLLGALSAVCAAESPHDGSLADTNLRFIGRWDRHDSKLFHGHWSGHYVRTGFTGTTVKAQIAADANVQVSIDGGPFQEIAGKAGVVNLTPQPLAAGNHTLLLTTRREEDEIQLQKLEFDPGASTLPSPEHPIIEFIGDSITTNAGDRKDYKDFTVTKPYSWRVAELLGADHVQVSESGVPLTTGHGYFAGKVGMETQYFKARNFHHKVTDLWEGGYVPAIVVINLGTNDNGVKDADCAVTYEKFLRNVRVRNPNAAIVVMRTFNGSLANGTRQAVDALVKSGDKEIQFVDTAGWLEASDYMDGIHPTSSGSLKAAKRLSEILAPLLPKKTE